MAFYGLDAHKKFIQSEVIDAPAERSKRSFMISTNVEAIARFAGTLGPEDAVALESTTHAFPIAQLLRRSGARAVVSNPMKTKIIAESKTKTDRVDSLALANLLAADFLPTVWEPDEQTEKLRKITSYAQAITRQKTAVKNRIHYILHRNLVSCGQFSDLFGANGRAFLQTLALPEDERFQLDRELALLDYLDADLRAVKERMARYAIADEETLRLMTLPGADFPTAL